MASREEISRRADELEQDGASGLLACGTPCCFGFGHVCSIAHDRLSGAVLIAGGGA